MQFICINGLFILCFISFSGAFYLPNGTLKLIIKTYIDDIVSNPEIMNEIAKSKLMGLSDHVVTHPALRQKHLYIGEGPPNYTPDEYTNIQNGEKIKRIPPTSASDHEEKLRIQQELQQRLSSVPENFPSEEICTTNRQWEQINSTHDFYENPVEVIHEQGLQQFIYTYRCASTKETCMGISSLYHSECTERHGWVYMYFRKQGEETPRWGYVAAPHHCACKIQPKFGPTTPTEERKRK